MPSARSRAAWTSQLHTMEQRIDAVGHLMDTYRPKELRELCEALTRYREEKADLEAQVQRVSEVIEAVSQVLAEKFVALGKTSETYTDLGTFSLYHKLYVTTENKEALFTWVRNHQMDTLIQEYIPPRTVESLVRERYENGEPVEGMGVKATFKQTVR